jgi:hypothetical protein
MSVVWDGDQPRRHGDVDPSRRAPGKSKAGDLLIDHEGCHPLSSRREKEGAPKNLAARCRRKRRSSYGGAYLLIGSLSRPCPIPDVALYVFRKSGRHG